MYITILLVGSVLVLIQGLSSFLDGFITQSQMIDRGVMNGYSFMEHGGMWADFLIITPTVAFIVNEYQLPYASTRSMVILAVATVGLVLAAYQWQQLAAFTPEAHAHNGYTTVAGYIHLIYAIISMWIIVLFLISPYWLNVQKHHLIIIAVLLSIWAILGVMKFSPRWTCENGIKIQVAVEVFIIWVATAGRIVFQP